MFISQSPLNTIFKEILAQYSHMDDIYCAAAAILIHDGKLINTPDKIATFLYDISDVEYSIQASFPKTFDTKCKIIWLGYLSLFSSKDYAWLKENGESNLKLLAYLAAVSALMLCTDHALHFNIENSINLFTKDADKVLAHYRKLMNHKFYISNQDLLDTIDHLELRNFYGIENTISCIFHDYIKMNLPLIGTQHLNPDPASGPNPHTFFRTSPTDNNVLEEPFFDDKTSSQSKSSTSSFEPASDDHSYCSTHSSSRAPSPQWS